MKRFQLYKVVRNGRLMHITSYTANDRREAIDLFKKDNKSAKIGFGFWNYYVTGITHTNPTHIKLAHHGNQQR